MPPRSSSPAAPVPIQITDLAFGGSGVARNDGVVWFVPFTIPGEEVSARVMRRKKRFAEAQMVKVLIPSPDRVEPGCPYFGRCGGCTYQHIAYPRQVELKAVQVEQTLRRVGRLAEVPMRDAVASPENYGYRNRIRVHVADGVVGFYAAGAHQLIDIERCPIARPEVNDALTELRSHPVQDGDYVLRVAERGLFFEQTNDGVARLLLDLVRAAIRPNQKTLIDAYCGAGFFAKGMVDLFPEIIGIEENTHAVDYARSNAQEHERYLCGSVDDRLGDVLVSHDMAATTLVLDPPAAGLSPRVADLLMGTSPAHVLYVSCDPATMARDLGLLCRSAFRLVSVTPLDMFPQTAEIEVLAELERVGG